MALSRADLKILKTKYFPTNGRQLVKASDARKFFDAIIESAVNTVDDGTTIANVNADWLATSGAAEILNKPSTFTPSSHTHVISAITGLQDALDLLASIIYVDGEVSGLQSQIDGISALLSSDNINLDTIQEIVDAIENVQTWIDTIIVNDLVTGGTTKALSAQMGVTIQAQLDDAFSQISTKAEQGDLVGLSSHVDDLEIQIGSKAESSDVVAFVDALQLQIDGINILLSSDNIDLDTVQEIVDAIETVQLSLSTILVNDLITGGTTKALTAQQGVVLKGLIDALTTVVNGKQETLVSGTNIKTVNGVTILGSGDLEILIPKSIHIDAYRFVGIALTSPPTAAASLVVISSVTGAIGMLLRGGNNQDDGFSFSFMVPENYVSNGRFSINITTGVSASNVKIFLGMARNNSGDNYGTLSETDLNVVTSGVGTANLIKVVEIIPTFGIAPGDDYTIKVWRNPDDAQDTANISLYIQSIDFLYD